MLCKILIMAHVIYLAISLLRDKETVVTRICKYFCVRRHQRNFPKLIMVNKVCDIILVGVRNMTDSERTEHFPSCLRSGINVQENVTEKR